jgi:hypothetical protein
MAMMAIEIISESAASLIKLVTVHNFPVGSIAASLIVSWLPSLSHGPLHSALAQIFMGVATPAAPGGNGHNWADRFFPAVIEA